MSLIKRMRKQYAVYWAPMEMAGRDGQPRYEHPIEIRCRWEDGINRKVTTEATTITSTAMVYVDRVLLQGGRLMKGKISEIGITENTPPPEAAKEILKVNELPKLNAREFLRTVYC